MESGSWKWKPAQFSCLPAERERRLQVVDAKSVREQKTVEWSPEWRVTGRSIRTSAKGATVKVMFEGNRIDLIDAFDVFEPPL